MAAAGSGSGETMGQLLAIYRALRWQAGRLRRLAGATPPPSVHSSVWKRPAALDATGGAGACELHHRKIERSRKS